GCGTKESTGPAADYTLSLAPAALTIVQGSTGNTTVTITRTNFTDAVTLSLGGAPTGVTGSFNPAAPTGTSATLTVSVGATVVPGVYNLTVNGSGSARGLQPHGRRDRRPGQSVDAARAHGERGPGLHTVAHAGGAHDCPGRDRHHDPHDHPHQFRRRGDLESGQRAHRGHGVVQSGGPHPDELRAGDERRAGCV